MQPVVAQSQDPVPFDVGKPGQVLDGLQFAVVGQAGFGVAGFPVDGNAVVVKAMCGMSVSTWGMWQTVQESARGEWPADGCRLHRRRSADGTPGDRFRPKGAWARGARG
ncbi:MAG: hypothetical protein Ct9H300mP1_15150 [Planctomycetaceae bacterium]|nr:MAG: hypothetical protein Ct9H300mP1_15150 [Planctomycetaceae bacterium]